MRVPRATRTVRRVIGTLTLYMSKNCFCQSPNTAVVVAVIFILLGRPDVGRMIVLSYEAQEER